MRAIVEFGVRGERCSQHVFPTAKAAGEFAAKLSYVFGRDRSCWQGTADPSKSEDFRVSRRSPRVSWQSSTHYVSVSLLDGVPRG